MFLTFISHIQVEFQRLGWHEELVASMELRKVLQTNPALETVLNVNALLSLAINTKENKGILRYFKKDSVFPKLIEHVLQEGVPAAAVAEGNCLVSFCCVLFVFRCFLTRKCLNRDFS
jgi:hypothetical protein